MTQKKTPEWAGATPLLTACNRQKYCGVAPARPERLGAVFARVQESENARRETGRKAKPTRRKRSATWQLLRHHPSNQSQ